MHLCKKVSEQSKIKVLYSGDGADEVFGGYERHYDILQKKNIKKFRNNFNWKKLP